MANNTWDKLREAALESGGVVAADEHVYVLSHVCHQRSLRNTDARMGDVYKRAVRLVVSIVGGWINIVFLKKGNVCRYWL